MASRTVFYSRETSMKTQNGISSKTKGIAAAAAVILVCIAALVGMKMEFDSMQSLDWIMADAKAVEGYQWLANNTESDATVLAWWDYADGIKEIGHRQAVINEASDEIKNTVAGYAFSGKPWHKIEYALWYPFESSEKVNDVANFFLSEDVTSARNIAEKYGANYVLVMSKDLGKYYPVILAAGGNFSEYLNTPTNRTSGNSDKRQYIKKDTVFTKMVNGDSIEGTSKAFDNGHIRIYKLELKG